MHFLIRKTAKKKELKGPARAQQSKTYMKKIDDNPKTTKRATQHEFFTSLRSVESHLLS